MKKFIFFLFFIFSIFRAESTENVFEIERLSTDFKGIAYNGKNVICYGDYGIMTYSFNKGKTWKQLNIGDKYSICKLSSLSSDFYGVTEYSLLKSTDNGLNWVNKEIYSEPRITGMTIYDNNIYFLSNYGIYQADFNLNVNPTALLTLDSNYEYSELEYDGTNFYLIYDNKYLIVFNPVSQTIDTIDLIGKFTTQTQSFIANLKIFDGIIYAQIGYPVLDDINYYWTVYSPDNGKTWQSRAQDFQNGNCYKVIGNEIFFLRPGYFSNPSHDPNLVNDYFKIDSSHYSVDSTYITKINTAEKVERYFYYGHEDYFSDFIIINRDTIIAAGVNKLISVSYNGGKSFEIKSSFKAYNYLTANNLQIINDSLMYIVSGYSLYKSVDGGVTWTTQKYYDYNYTNWNYIPIMFYFGENGYGFSNYRKINSNNDSNAIITYDAGENFVKTNKADLNFSQNTLPLYINGLDLGDKVLFQLKETKDTISQLYSYLMLNYDKELNLTDSNTIISDKFVNIVPVNNDRLIALCFFESGTNSPDSTGKTEDYFYRFSLLESTDKGINWKKLDINTPFKQILKKAMNGKYYWGNPTIKNAVLHGDYIYYPTTNNIIYKFNYVDNSFDSLNFPAELYSYYPQVTFFFDSKLYVVTNYYENVIYYTEDWNSYNCKWDSLRPSDLLSKWEPYNFQHNSGNTDMLMFSKTMTDTSAYLVLGNSKSYNSFKVNLAKISKKKATDIPESGYRTEQERAYLWNDAPYPMPGKNYINTQIFWNKYYSPDELIINVYDLNGSKINAANLSLVQTAPYSGKLTWDCSNVPSGVYLIRISLASESKTFQVIVNR